MDNTVFFWLGISALFLCLELIHPVFFFFLSFAGAAILAAASVIFEFTYIGQGLVFLGGTCLVFGILRLWLLNQHNFSRSHYQSNAYALIGKKAVVMLPVDSINPGQVKVGGQFWLARAIGQEKIDAGTTVEILSVVGCHLIVRSQGKEKL